MGQIEAPRSVLLVLAVSSQHDQALRWSQERAEAEFGSVALASKPFEFSETDYYAATMGTGLRKQFLSFERPIDPGELPHIKRQTNEWEVEFASLGQHTEPRPVNLDPGYLTLAKLVLASTKDHAHRIYLGSGIYAEVTLVFRHKKWASMEWTYPDYRRADYQAYFSSCRDLLRDSKHG